jgi:hypothetical protein
VKTLVPHAIKKPASEAAILVSEYERMQKEMDAKLGESEWMLA